MAAITFKPVPFFTLGIIGTAGRGDDAKLLNANLYDRMYLMVERAVSNMLVLDGDMMPFTLISGGAAWADHLAVRFFFLNRERYPMMGLRLELPAKFDEKRCEFISEGGKAASTANLYHRKMAENLWGSDNSNGSLDDIAAIVEMSKNPDNLVVVNMASDTYGYRSFFERNAEVARLSTCLMAFTSGGPDGVTTPEKGFTAWSGSRVRGLKDGGTSDTWDKARHAKCWHIDITRI